MLVLLAEAVRAERASPDPATVNEIAALLRSSPEGAGETAARLGREGVIFWRATSVAGGGWDRRELALFD